MIDWQPISTVPERAERLLLFFPSGEVGVIHNWDRVEFEVMFGKPTHWAPINLPHTKSESNSSNCNKSVPDRATTDSEMRMRRFCVLCGCQLGETLDERVSTCGRCEGRRRNYLKSTGGYSEPKKDIYTLQRIADALDRIVDLLWSLPRK